VDGVGVVGRWVSALVGRVLPGGRIYIPRLASPGGDCKREKNVQGDVARLIGKSLESQKKG